MDKLRDTFLCTAGISLILYLMAATMHSLNKKFYGDFVHFYHAAQAILNNQNIYASGTGGYIYPPFFAFLISPLAKLSLPMACGLWQWVNLILLLTVLYFCLRSLTKLFQVQASLWQLLSVCALALLFSYQELVHEFRWNQTDLLILTGITLGFYWLKDKPVLAGLCLGIIANIKYQPLFFLPFLLLRGRWRNSLGFCLGLALTTLAPVILLGWELNGLYLITAAKGMAHPPGAAPSPDLSSAHMPTIMWVRNITVTNGLLRIFQAHHWPLIWTLIPIAFLGLALILVIWVIYRKHHIPLFWRFPWQLQNANLENAIIHVEYLTLLASIFIFSPQGLVRHLLLLLPLNIFAALVLLLPRSRLTRWPMFVGILIIQLGKLYGAISPITAENWRFIGGPGWTLLSFIPFFCYNGLLYAIYLYGKGFIAATLKRKYHRLKTVNGRF